MVLWYCTAVCKSISVKLVRHIIQQMAVASCLPNDGFFSHYHLRNFACPIWYTNINTSIWMNWTVWRFYELLQQHFNRSLKVLTCNNKYKVFTFKLYTINLKYRQNIFLKSLRLKNLILNKLSAVISRKKYHWSILEKFKYLSFFLKYCISCKTFNWRA
jgi:hypothetical protein